MKTVLVVDDDKDIAKALKMRLSVNGYDVHLAHDAATAGIVARKCQPDIALLDISMPGGDGFDVAERLRGIVGNLPIIFLTANSRADLRRRAMDIGAKAFFEKPFSSGELVDALAALETL